MQNIQIIRIKFRKIVELLLIKQINKIDFFNFKIRNFLKLYKYTIYIK